MADHQPVRSGCGVQGCLYAAVALFVVLLVAMMIIAAYRFSQPPVPRGIGAAPPEPAALALGGEP